MFWAPYTRSNGEYIANKVLQGLFGSAVESLPEISVTDIVSSIAWIDTTALRQVPGD